ncbi:hypothetical protein PRIPAC_91031, partial [Pristionchus pacificus]|uniref:Uncharacterized protein n=1 Tax=Pristionchus pacificus TaxID=54126 RepID=A0A2A6CIP9_PRIPA
FQLGSKQKPSLGPTGNQTWAQAWSQLGNLLGPKHSHIPTVSMIRKQQKKRLNKKRRPKGTSIDSLDHLSLHLKTLASSSITVDRPEWERREKGSKMSVPAWLLGKIFDWSSDKDREYLRGKYEDEIRMGLMMMNFKRLQLSISRRDIASLILTNSSMKNKLAIRITKGLDCLDESENNSRYHVSIRLLLHGLRSTTGELKDILGMGLLCDAARYYTSKDDPRDDRIAQIFRHVLDAHPEWRENFRIATIYENPISHTGLLGQSIQPRRSNPGLYIIMDEDTEII